jgi:ubiquinone/menaquinone biosynthesis C-methylase UbiE
MRRETLDLLCCPGCGGELRLEPGIGAEGRGGEVVGGKLLCAGCGKMYPIEDGIPRFIGPEDLDSLNRRFSRFYDWFSWLYPVFMKLGFLAFGGERKGRMEVLGHLDPGGGSVLEVSVGTGSNLPHLFESVGAGDVYGLDVSAGQLGRCRSLVDKRGWPVDLFMGTAEALPFKACSFDSVLHIGGINFFSGKKEAIDEMIRVARPGARIVIADESEQVARNIARVFRLGGRERGGRADLCIPPTRLVPDTMEDIRVDDIWKAHGEYHGYCLRFRKPSS